MCIMFWYSTHDAELGGRMTSQSGWRSLQIGGGSAQNRLGINSTS